MSNEVKTNAMRILDKENISYKVNVYECDEFIDGMHIADKCSQPYEVLFKTLVVQGRSREYYVFCLPTAEELDLKKAAALTKEKSVQLIAIKDINKVTGYIRGGCSPIGMKKQFKTFLHSSSLDLEEIVISGGKMGTQILINPKDLIKVTNAQTGDIIIRKD